MKSLISVILIIVIILLALGVAMSPAMTLILTGVIPYVVFVILLAGFAYRIVIWGKAPVPFRIPTTCGQEKSLPWIKANPVENPAGPPGHTPDRGELRHRRQRPPNCLRQKPRHRQGKENP